ncbi:MAG: tRNA (adenosine(37)-N6)-dimethylallyltransferase MiaA [Candidatus Daviesbacteria bacterium]|nr:tRNA (adenosine(37)-N6)-dimethylallyltransferase MiaA [Candidatus Daviesbacteria bacterium]
MKKVLVILGPTSTGKTDLGLHLAKKYNGELVACDSRQVYKGLDIGTGKMPGKDLRFKKYDLRWEIDGINIWMYDVADPKQQYTVKDYVTQAEKIIEDIISRKKLPIIVGGTGLYLKALLEGLPNLVIQIDEKLRGDLEKLSKEKLQEKLQSLSPISWENLNESDRQNPRRLLRSIELITMNPYIKTTQNLVNKNEKYDTLKIGLTAPREVLQKRIFDRLLSRFNSGLVEEVTTLHNNGLNFERMKQLGLEYGAMVDFLQGNVSKEEIIIKLTNVNYQYAKRQMTWFKKQKDILWVNIDEPTCLQQVESQVQKWYYLKHDKAD